MDAKLTASGRPRAARDNENGELQIDGELSGPKPLNALIRFQPGELTIPPNRYLIVPSGVPYLNGTSRPNY